MCGHTRTSADSNERTISCLITRSPKDCNIDASGAKSKEAGPTVTRGMALCGKTRFELLHDTTCLRHGMAMRRLPHIMACADAHHITYDTE